MAPDGRLDLGRRAVGGHDDGQVALGREVARRRGHPRIGRSTGGQAGDRDLGDVDPLGAQVERGDASRDGAPRPGRRDGRRPSPAPPGPGAGWDRPSIGV